MPRIKIVGLNSAVLMQVAGRPGASRTDGVAELKRQLAVADADITLVNRRLDESQGKCFCAVTW